MTTRLTNLDTPFTFQFNVATSGTPEQLQVKLSAATIAFVEGGADQDTITDSASGFLKAGFQVGDQITVSGSASNNSTFTIAAVTAGVITLALRSDLTTEAAGATVKIVASKTIRDGISVTLKAKYANVGTIYVGYSTESAHKNSNGNFTLRNNESLSFQVNNTDKIWLDASTSNEGVEVTLEQNAIKGN